VLLTTTNKDFKVKHGLSVSAGATFGQAIEIGEPTADDHAATKGYVDQSIFTAIAIAPVVVATTGPINLTTQTVVGTVIDGLTLGVGNRILVKNQANSAENGIYEVFAGTPAVRAFDYADASTVRPGGIVHVLYGITNGSTNWVLSVIDVVSVGVDPLDYTIVGTPFAGYGLLIDSGNSLAINETIVAKIVEQEDFSLALDPEITQSSLTSVGDLDSLTVTGATSLASANFSGAVDFDAPVTILEATSPQNPVTKDYVDNLLNQTSVEITTIDDLSNYFNGYNSRFLPTYKGLPVTLQNEFNLLLTIDGIIQSVGSPDYVWQSVMPRVGFRIDNDGYIAFPEPIPVGSSFDARVLVGSATTTQTKVYPFKAMDIVLGGY
jgi:hypothetical protein